jgi:cell division transport system permease protein
MGSLGYFLKEALRGLFQAKLMTLVSVVTIGASLFFMSLLVLGIYNINAHLKEIGDLPDLEVYIKDETLNDTIMLESLFTTIHSFKEVRKTVYIDKDSAWQRCIALYGKEVLASVDENPLPVSIEVYLNEKFRNSSSVEVFQTDLKLLPGVESVQYSSEWIRFIERFRNAFYFGTLLVGAIILLVLHIVISNTIKLTIYARKELIKNMQLVGATQFFINIPFIFEGIVQGVLGAFISCIALIALKVSLVNVPLFWGSGYSLFIIIIAGAFFGWIGSSSAVRKFLA